MARFFFDVRLGEREATDDEGIELASPYVACQQAEAALPSIAQEAPRTTEPEPLVLTVRDETGAFIYRGETVSNVRHRAHAKR